MDPGDEAQAPVAGIQADDARAQAIEAHPQGQQRLGKGSVMDVGRREQEEQGEPGAATEQRMDPVAAQQWTGVMRWRMANGGVRIAVAPGEDRRAIQDEIAGADEPTMEGEPDHDDQNRLADGSARAGAPFPLLRRARHPRLAVRISWQSAGICQRRPAD
jgi:hypothetical protein